MELIRWRDILKMVLGSDHGKELLWTMNVQSHCNGFIDNPWDIPRLN